MALPLLAVGVVGIYVYKKIRDKEYDDLKTEKEDLEEKQTKIFDIKSLPFMVASLYSIANIDGIIDEDEEAFIQNEIYKQLEKVEDDKLKENIEKSLKKIEQNKLSIKLSDALDYITPKNESIIKEKLREYKAIINDLAEADGRIDDREIELLGRFDIICENGRDAKKKIIELENQDLLPNYYLSSSGEGNKITPSTVVITQDDDRFLNICDLQFEECYVIHPMNPQYLFDLKDLDKIDELQYIELQLLASKLGAKSFSCSVAQEETETSNNIHNTSVHNSVSKGSADFDIGNVSSKEEYEKKFTQYQWTAKGNQSSDTKEQLLESLLWLKYDHNSKILIEAMTSDNKLESYQFEISFKKFKTSNSNFNLSAHLSLLGKINNELKRNIESNIQRSLDYKLKVNITF